MAIARDIVVNRAIFDWKERSVAIYIEKSATDTDTQENLGQVQAHVHKTESQVAAVGTMLDNLAAPLLARVEAAFPGWTVTITEPIV